MWVRALRRYTTRRCGLPRRQLQALTQALLDSPLVGANPLNGPFRVSRGFAMTFREEGRAEVEARFPTLRPWLERVLGAPATEALRPWWQRRSAPPNAWYLNLLLLGAGGAVKRHIDATLRTPAGVDEATPVVVSVLYLRAPQMRGGALELWSGHDVVAALPPRAGAAVHFRGDLAHAVTAIEGPPDTVRASLVIEQYRFGDEALARLPTFQLHSRAGFEAHVQAHQTHGIARLADAIER